MKPLVVLPTYNEAENILVVLGLIREHLPQGDVLVVDDGSPDGTADLAEKWGADNGGVTVLRRPEKAGLGSAYRAGFVFGLERGLRDPHRDGLRPPARSGSSCPALVHAVEDGADLAIGSRYVPGGSVPGVEVSRAG